MKKPIEFWTWNSLKFWILGGRKRRKSTKARTRRLRLEHLDARVVLAAEVLPELGPLATTEEVRSQKSESQPRAKAEVRACNPQSRIRNPQFLSPPRPCSPLAPSSSFDINADGVFSPLDVLIVVNVASDSTRGGQLSQQQLVTLDLNGAGAITSADAVVIAQHLTAASAANAASNNSAASDNREPPRGNARANQRDDDVDGIDGDEEDSAPNQGDGNRDGKRDKDQAGVGSFRDRRTGRSITLDAGKHKLVRVRSLDVRPEQAVAQRGPLNYGLIGFEVHDVKPGGVAEVRVIMPDDSQPTGYLKEDAATGVLVPFLFDGTTGAIIVGASIRLFLQDGGRGDADGLANCYRTRWPPRSVASVLPGW